MTTLSPDERIEQALADTWWVPDDVEVTRTADVVWVQSATRPGFNRCQRINPQMVGLEALVDDISDTHAGYGMPSRWSLCAPSCSEELERMLTRRGYSLVTQTRVHSMRVDADRPALNPRFRIRVCAKDADWVASDRVTREAFGWPSGPIDPDRLDEFRREGAVLTARKVVFLAEDAQTGTPVASAGLSTHPDCGLAIMHAGATLAEARGQGAYSALVTERMKWALRCGLSDVFVQADPATSGPIVSAQGFVPHGWNRMWGRDPAGVEPSR